MNITPRRSVAK